jgi:hypothetical protein
METRTEVCRWVLTGQVQRRACGHRLGLGLGSSRLHWVPWSPLFLNPNLPLVQEI